MHKYICQDCGTTYSTPEDRIPLTPKWSDGHVCELRKERTIKELEEIIKTIHSQCKDGVLSEHWIGWKTLTDLI